MAVVQSVESLQLWIIRSGTVQVKDFLCLQNMTKQTDSVALEHIKKKEFFF